VSKGGGDGFGQVLRDQLSCEARKGGEVTLTNGSEESRRNRATERCVVVAGKFGFGLVKSKDTIGLMRDRSGDGDMPQAIWRAGAGDNDLVLLEDFDIKFVEDSDAIIITELGQRDQGAGS